MAIDFSKFKVGDRVVRQKPCGDFCVFRFCKADGSRPAKSFFMENAPQFLLRDADVASDPFICGIIFKGKMKRVKVKESGQAKIRIGSSATRYIAISNYMQKDVKPRFAPNYFYLRSVTRPPIPGEKGVARRISFGNQEDFIDDVCVILPITAFDIVRFRSGEKKRSVPFIRKRDCIAFRTIVPSILVELTWQSSDDLNLRVVEPNGNVISNMNPNSTTGGSLILDQYVNGCGKDPDGKEEINWRRGATSPLSGAYTVEVRHFKNCRLGSTRSTLAVVINGKLEVLEHFVSNEDDDKLIKKITFKY